MKGKKNVYHKTLNKQYIVIVSEYLNPGNTTICLNAIPGNIHYLTIDPMPITPI